MSTTEYYYLDADNTPRGPHTLDELRQMLDSGTLSPDTEVSFKGAACWQPLVTVCESLPPIPEPPASSAGWGRQSAERVSYSDDMGLWDIFVFVVFKNYVTFSGRATRREYWSFVLVNFLISLMLAFFGLFTLPFTSNIYTLLVALPSVAVMFRRLHDVGRSGWWYLWSILACIPYLITGGYLVWNAVPVFESVEQSCLTQEEFDSQLNAEIFHMLQEALPWLILSILPALIVGIIIFIFTLQDSQRGTNQYGPSYKYPDTAP